MGGREAGDTGPPAAVRVIVLRPPGVVTVQSSARAPVVAFILVVFFSYSRFLSTRISRVRRCPSTLTAMLRAARPPTLALPPLAPPLPPPLRRRPAAPPVLAPLAMAQLTAWRAGQDRRLPVASCLRRRVVARGTHRARRERASSVSTRCEHSRPCTSHTSDQPGSQQWTAGTRGRRKSEARARWWLTRGASNNGLAERHATRGIQQAARWPRRSTRMHCPPVLSDPGICAVSRRGRMRSRLASSVSRALATRVASQSTATS